MKRRWGGLLWHREFRLLWTGETVSQTGNAMSNVLVPLLAVTTLHASTFDVSTLTAAAGLPWLVIGLPVGTWVDRWPARTIMLTCDVISAALYACLPLLAWLGLLALWQIAAVVLVAGAANVFFTTAYQVYLPALIKADDYVEGNAKLQGSASAALIGGRSAAGVAAEAVGVATAVLFNAVSFLISALCLLLIGTRENRSRHSVRTTTMRAEMAAGVRFLVRDRYLRYLTVYATIANFAYGGYTSLIVLFLVRVAGLGQATVGVLLASAGIGGIGGSLIARRLSAWLGTARTLLLTALTGSFSLLVPLTHAGQGIIYCLIGSVMMTVGNLIGSIILAAFRQAYCPLDMLGRVVGGQRFLAYGAIPAGALIAGSLGTAFGVRNALWITLGVFTASGMFLFTPAIVSVRDLPNAISATPASATSKGST